MNLMKKSVKIQFFYLISVFIIINSIIAVDYLYSTPPTDTNFITVSTYSLTVTWTDTDNSSYTVVLSSDQNFSYIISSDTINQNTTTYTNPPYDIVPNTTYWFKIKFSTDVPDIPPGTTDYSEPISTSTLSNIPTIGELTELSTYSVCANWGTNANPPYTEYYVECSSDNFSVLLSSSDWITQSSWVFTGLNPNTTYWFRVKSRNSNYIETEFQLLGSTMTYANPPTDLVITSYTSNSIHLKWSKNGNPYWTSYEISISTDNFQSHFSTPVPFSYNLITDTTEITELEPDTEYYFRVRAKNNLDLVTEFSNKVTTKTVDNIPPGSINDLTALPGPIEGTVQLSWTSPGDNGYVGKTSEGEFIIKKTTDTTLSWDGMNDCMTIQKAIIPYESNSITITGLIPGTTFYFAIKAKDEAGNINPSEPEKAGTWVQVDVTPPAPITSIVPIEKGFRYVKLRWIAPCEDGTTNNPHNPGNYSGKFWIKYSSCEIKDDGLWNSATTFVVISYDSITRGATVSYTITGLTNNTTYYFAIKTCDDSNNWSTISSSSPKSIPVNTQPSTPVPNLPQVKISSSTYYTFSWQASSPGGNDIEYGDYISSYTLYIATFTINDSTIGNSLTIYFTSATFYTVYNLNENTTYWWILDAIDSENYHSSKSNFSKNINWIAINSSNEPPLPFSLISVSTSLTGGYQITTSSGGILNIPDANKNIIFKWNSTIDPDPGDFVSGYFLYYSTDINFKVYSSSFITGTSYRIQTPLIDNTTYYWFVVARDSGAPFGYSVLFTTTPVWSFRVNGENESPNPFNLISPSPNSIVFTSTPVLVWENKGDPDPGDFISKYYIYYSSFNETQPKVVIFNSSGIYEPVISTITVPLQENTTYTWFIKAEDNGSGYGACLSTTSNLQSFIVNMTSEPPNTFNLISPSGISRSYTQIFSWELTTDPDLFDNVINYQVYYSTDINFDIKLTTFSPLLGITSFYVCPTTFGINIKYYWNVRAYDTTGLYTLALSTKNFIFTNSPPNKFNLIYPVNKIVISSPTIVFNWQNAFDIDGDTVKYTLYYSITPNFIYSTEPDRYGSVTDLTTTYYELTASLTENATYYWKVEATDSYAITVSSTVGIFRINYGNEPPGQFTLINPDGDTYKNFIVVKTSTPTLRWAPSFDPDPDDSIKYYSIFYSSFDILLADISSFKGNVSGIQTSTITIPLVENAVYSWKIIAYDNNGSSTTVSGGTGGIGGFIVNAINELPDKFDLIKPTNNSILKTRKPVFEWTDAGKTEYWEQHKYNLRYGQTDKINSLNIVPDLVVISTQLPTELLENTTYWWEVECVDSAGNKRLSNQKYYIYIDSSNEPPSNFELVSPQNNSVIKSRKPNFLWNKASDPDEVSGDIVTYTIKYWYNIQKTTWSYSVSTNVFVGSSNSYIPTEELMQATTYYWQVIANDTVGNQTVTQQYSFYIDILTKLKPPENIKITLEESPIFGKKSYIIWDPVTKNEDGSSCINELKGYNIYVSTDLGSNRFYLLGFTDKTEYVDDYTTLKKYYVIRAVSIQNKESDDSTIVSIEEEKPVIIKVSEQKNAFVIISSTLSEMMNNNQETINIIEQEPDLYEIKVVKNSIEQENYLFSDFIKIIMKYRGQSVARTNKMFGTTFIYDDTKPAIFYYNGVEYVHIGGEINSVDNTISIKVNRTGKYKIKYITDSEQNFELTTIEPKKMFTPNNDGKWDEIKFYIINKTANQVTGEIYNLSNEFIAKMRLKSDIGTYLVWDGKDETGNFVRKGIYIYQIKCGDIVKNGTIIVVR